MPISIHPYDGSIWYETSLHIIKNGPFSLHAFPPLWSHYMLIPVAYIYSWLHGFFPYSSIPVSNLPQILDFYPSYSIQSIPDVLFNFLVKVPFLLSDILITILLYKIVLDYKKDKAFASSAALLWFLNPFVIFISSTWGMWDTMPALFSLASFYFLSKKRIAISAICLSLGVASKLYPLLILVPLLIYAQKPEGLKKLQISRYFIIFCLTSLILIIPSIGASSDLISIFVYPTQNQAAAIVGNPVNQPLGAGLSYWSLLLLNRFTNLSINVGLVNLLSLFSISAMALLLLFVYWKTSRGLFLSSPYGLISTLLLALTAIFLSYRFVFEQWFIWAIPFFVILCINGTIKLRFYWGITGIALIYSILNCPLPVFFLPTYPYTRDILVSAQSWILSIDQFRIVLLSILGCAFSGLLLINFYHLIKLNKK
jgi:hypothetical protein